MPSIHYSHLLATSCAAEEATAFRMSMSIWMTGMQAIAEWHRVIDEFHAFECISNVVSNVYEE